MIFILQALRFGSLIIMKTFKMIVHKKTASFFIWIPAILVLIQTCVATNTISYTNEDDVVQNSVQSGRAQYEMINRDANMPRYKSIVGLKLKLEKNIGE